MATALPPEWTPKHPSEQDFSIGLKWSFIAHLALMILILVKGVVFPEKPIPYFPSLRVDLVDLPDVLKKDLGKAPPPEALEKADVEVKKPKTEPTQARPRPVETTQRDEMALRPKPQDINSSRQKKLKNALARIKALAKIHAENEGETPQIVKGNKISKGSSLSGDARESAMTSYYDLIRDHLQEAWSLSVWLNRQDLTAQVHVFIDERGRLHHFKFLKISGNPQFDATVKRTLMDSQPYPIPPASLGNNLLLDGIVIGFPL